MSKRNLQGHSSLRAILFMRYPRPGFFSIEGVFDTIVKALPNEIDAEIIASPFPSKGIFNRVRACWAAASIMKQKKSEVAHVVGDAHYLVFCLPRRRTVLTIHDCDFLTGKSAARRWLLWLFWIYLPVRAATIVTTISERSKAQIIALTCCDPSRVRVIENPLSPHFSPVPVSEQRRPRVLHIGTKQNKNLPRLIEALAGLDVDLTIIGRLAEAHLRLLQKTNISFENLVDVSDQELVAAYRDCTLVSFVSTSEGFGMPIIEAQAIGRPVLTSNIEPMVSVAGDAALFVNPSDIIDIRQGLIKLLDNSALRKDLVERGFINVMRFDARSIAGRYAELYASLAGRH